MEVPQLALRDLPEELGSFQTARKRLIRWAVDGTWEKIFAAVLAAADAVGSTDLPGLLPGTFCFRRREMERTPPVCRQTAFRS